VLRGCPDVDGVEVRTCVPVELAERLLHSRHRAQRAAEGYALTWIIIARRWSASSAT